MKFFDTKEQTSDLEGKSEDKPKVRNVVDRDAMAAANKAMKDAGIETDYNLGGQAQDQGIIPIRYTKEVFGNWQIDHGRRGDDYMFQLIPRRPIRADVRAVIEAVIRILSGYVPSDIEVFINPPNPGLEIDFYTVRLEGVMKKPGSEVIVSKKLPEELGGINAWPT